MNPSTPSVETILAKAVEFTEPGKRQAFVEEACGGDPALKHRVNRLIANHFEAGSFLEVPAAALDPNGTAAWETAAHAPGTLIGPYKLLELIGEGGMGLVYVAEQHQPIKRRVALKIIKPGMDSRQVVARFEAERQALAMMDHPNIAKVFDGGTIGSESRTLVSDPAQPLTNVRGSERPYFVMELVKGTPITDYCDANRLTTRQRLELFLDVCHAVQHAHQKGIIHRDLKPSNVMVTVHDVKPIVKVIDFGIAKATGGQLTDKTIYTQFAQLVGTPLYMSPEQAGLSGLDVDTRSDVYSLGVLLYELLAGTTPFESATLMKAGYDEMRRIIREDEPLRPSARLSTMQQANLSTIAQQRGLEPHYLTRHLRGELDWVVMKALEKDRGRRYESASAFADDVQRYLHDAPVQACPPSAAYRFRKFAQRNKAMLVAVAIVAVAILVGTAVSVWQAVEANLARGLANDRLEKETEAHADAEQQRQRAQASYAKAMDAVKRMLKEVGDERLVAIPQMQMVRERLLEDAATLYTELIALNPLDADAYFARAHIYRLTAQYDRELADLEKTIELDPTNGSYHFILAFALHYSPGLDEAARQRALFHQKRAAELLTAGEAHEAWATFYSWTQQNDKAIAEYKKVAENAPGTVGAYGALAEIASLTGNLSEERMNRENAIKAIEQQGHLGGTIQAVNRYFSVNPLPNAVAWQLISLAKVFQGLGDQTQALTVLNRCLGISGVSGHSRAWALLKRADLLMRQRKYSAALADYDAAIQLDPEARVDWSQYKRRGWAHFYLGHYQQALADVSKAVELVPQDASNLVWIGEAQIAACPDESFRKGILALADRTVELLHGKPDTEKGGEVNALVVRARLHDAMNQPEQARTDLIRAFELCQTRLAEAKAKPGSEDAATLETMCRLVMTDAKTGNLDRVEPVLVDLLTSLRKKDGPTVDHGTLAELGLALLKAQKYSDAEPVVRACLAVRMEKLPEDWRRFNAMSLLGEALLGQKKYAEAEPLLLKGYEGMKQRESQILPVGKIRLPEAAERLVHLYEETNQPEKAAAWKEKLKAEQASSGSAK
jgi:serine/threonine protein kinase/regulator of sirC expression with transglutaminase-like and TPR domain